MKMPRIDKTICKELHTECPVGYMAWHGWAEDMSETHTQRKCPECGRYAIWIPKQKRKLNVQGEK